MIAVDTNVLVYAHREEFPRHRAARDRLVELAEGDAPWALPVFVVGELLSQDRDFARFDGLSVEFLD